jgi:iron complex outermembrane recepter protein
VARDYTPAKDSLFYGSLATGFKGGGFNLSGVNADTFRPEKVTAFEVGFKNDFLEGKLRTNVSPFYNDYKN